MQLFLVLTFLFAVGAVCGWVLELFFRRFVHGKWVNPGFLRGPYLPLYGFGLVLLFLIACIPLDGISQVWLRYVILSLIICAAMTGVEYISGLIFIKGMGIKLWDYSDRRGNIQGIICPLFSFFWTVIGALYVFLLHPVITEAVIWFTDNLYYSFFVGIFFGLFIWDLASTLRLSVKIRAFAKEYNIAVKYEELKLTMRSYLESEKKKHKFGNFVNPFKSSSETFKASLAKYLEDFKSGKYTLKNRRKRKETENAASETDSIDEKQK